MTDANDDLTLPLKWSIERAKDKRLIAALKAENALLRSKLSERENFDIAADSVPSFFKNQIGPTS